MKKVKTLLIVVVALVMALSFAACGGSPNASDGGDNSSIVTGGEDQTQTPDKPSGGDESEEPDDTDQQKILVAYFSCTNNTKNWAINLQAKLDADIYEITPTVPYTSADLNYNTDCRANREQNNSAARPEISGEVDNMSQYDVVYIGYPIWWGQAPKIIYTFIERYDFSGKAVIPFCTSASSPMGSSGTNLHGCAPDAIWKSGCRVSGTSNIDALVNEIKR